MVGTSWSLSRPKKGADRQTPETKPRVPGLKLGGESRRTSPRLFQWTGINLGISGKVKHL